MAGNDPYYRLFFSHPRMVEDLLRGFVHEDWVSRLDFGTLERVNGSFVSDDLKDRRNDVVWRLRWLDGEGWFYVYLLLEFQSKPEPFMAVRLLVYVGLLLQDLIRTQGLKAKDQLPPILPVVFYSGRRPWRAPLDLLALFAPVPEDLRRRLPRLEYFLLDENRLGSEDKERAGNLVSALVQLETSADAEEFSRSTQKLGALLPKGESTGLRRLFASWAVEILRRTHRGATIPQVEDLEEVPMLEEAIIAWEKRAWRRGRKEGREEGREEGRLLGVRQTVIRLLEQRFGPISAKVRRQLREISLPEDLERIADKILTAGSLQELGLG